MVKCFFKYIFIMRLNNFVYNVFLQKLDFFTKIKYIAYELVERPWFNLIWRAD